MTPQTQAAVDIEIVDRGHAYRLPSFDGERFQTLTFMKREGSGYPGNVGKYPGTNLQSVLRACLDRVTYLQSQIPHDNNSAIICHLRHSLRELEQRAAERHGFNPNAISLSKASSDPMCAKCGHVACSCENATSVVPSNDSGALRWNPLVTHEEWSKRSLGGEARNVSADSDSGALPISESVTDRTCTHHNDVERTEAALFDNGKDCPVCTKRALPVSQEKLWEVRHVNMIYCGKEFIALIGLDDVRNKLIDAHNATLSPTPALPVSRERGEFGEKKAMITETVSGQKELKPTAFAEWYLLHGVPLGIGRENARVIYEAALNISNVVRPALEALKEVMKWHSDKESSEYNECDIAPCAWCDSARLILLNHGY